ncbi:MAG: murein biosynthesis integral membrane protein MurJ [Oscillospiraceae bacterium]|nr:murein biosynthesis integral membrane protein MurJ [Oscillospiraceae bacterium]
MGNDGKIQKKNQKKNGEKTELGAEGGKSWENAAKNIGFVMFLSTAARGVSLLASIMYTTYFGTENLEIDIYSYAVNLPNLIFTCIGAALVTVVIPIYAGRLAEGDNQRAHRFTDNIISISIILSAAIAVAGFFAAPLIVGLLNRFGAGNFGFAVFAIRIMFPVVIFHSLNYIFQGVLQSNNRFVMPAIVSLASGAAIIAYQLTLADEYGVSGLLFVTFAGLSLQALMLVPAVAATGYRYKPRIDLRDDDVRRAGKLALPVLVSSSSYQINMFINSSLAAGFTGGVITISNAHNLVFTAAQLFILSTLAVMFPKMSAQFAVKDIAGFKSNYSMVLKLIIYFAVPASAGLAAMSGHIISFLYGYGRMTEEGVGRMAAVFAVYAVAIASIGFKEAADRAFYSMKDSKTPALVSVFILISNVALSLILINRLGIVGLPCAYSASITAGAALLLFLVRKRTGALIQHEKDGESIKSMLLKCVISSIIMTVVIILSDRFVFSGIDGVDGVGVMAGRVLRLLLPVVVGAASYFLLTLGLKVEQARRILRAIATAIGLKRLSKVGAKS